MRSRGGGSSICSPGWSRSRSSSRTGERFRLLDTVRQYAAERLEAAAERDTVGLRHLDWCLALAEEHDPLSAGPRRSLQVLESEHDNLRAGLAWALRRDPQAALRLATRLWRFWLDRGYFAEGNRWLQTTLAAAPEQTPLRVEALLAGAGLSLRLGDPNGFLRHVSDAVSAYRLLGDERATAAALYQHAMLAQFVHRADAEALFAEALALARRLEDDRLLAVATHASATLPWYRGDNAAARARVLEALALLDAAPDDDTPFFDGVTFGMCLLDEGPHRRPRMFWEETVFLFHRFARAQAIAYALNNLAWVARADGDLEQAQATLDDALARFRRLRGPAGRGAHPRAYGQPLALAGRLRGRARASGGGAHDPQRPRRSPRHAQHPDRTRPAGHDGRRRSGGSRAAECGARPRSRRSTTCRRWPACRPTGRSARSASASWNRQRACTRTAARCWAFRGCSASRRGAAWRCMTSAWRSATSPVPRRRCSAHGRSSSPSATRAGCPTRTLSRR